MKSLSRSVVIFPVIGLIIFGYSFPVVNIAYAQSTLALQEKCAEGAKKYFFGHINSYGGSWGIFRDFGGSKGLGRNHFTSHYNKKLDKCFIRIEFSFIPEDKNEMSINTIDIYNVFEGSYFGGFSPKPSLMCEVGNKTCKSQQEFEALIKPFMEE